MSGFKEGLQLYRTVLSSPGIWLFVIGLMVPTVGALVAHDEGWLWQYGVIYYVPALLVFEGMIFWAAWKRNGPIRETVFTFLLGMVAALFWLVLVLFALLPDEEEQPPET